MSVVTAQIIAGSADVYRDGINPLNVLWFSEGGSRPNWVLERASLLARFGDPQSEDVGPADPVTLIPERYETALDDGLLLLILRGIADEHLTVRSKHLIPSLLSSAYVDLHMGKHDPGELEELREIAAECEVPCQLTVTLFQGCSLYEQLQELDKYLFNIEACTPTYSRQRSPWSPDVAGFGTLDIPPPTASGSESG